MTFQKKKKELKPEEVRDLLLGEVAPLWNFYSKEEIYTKPDPWFGCVESEDGNVFLLPLRKNFNEETYILGAVSPFDPRFSQMVTLFKEFETRYSRVGVRTCVVLLDFCSLFFEKKWVDTWRQTHDLFLPLFWDRSGLCPKSVSAQSAPFVVAIHHGSMVGIAQAPHATAELEKKLQVLLRPDFPGVPFALPSQNAALHSSHLKTMTDSKISTLGTWSTRGEALFTEDPKAEIVWEGKCQQITLCAGPALAEGIDATIAIQLDERPEEGYQVEDRGMIKIDMSEASKVRVKFNQARNRPMLVFGMCVLDGD